MDIQYKNANTVFFGDWHGSMTWALRHIRHFAHCEIMYHVGDFGVWHGDRGNEYRAKINRELKNDGRFLIVTLGNHENYDLLDEWRSQTGDGTTFFEPGRPNLMYLYRGAVWEHSGYRFASMGGTYSIDKRLRKQYDSWWPQEAISQDDLDALERSLRSREWENVDILITHDAPASANIKGTMKLDPVTENEAYAQRMLLQQAVDLCTPQWVIHGHWHRAMLNQISTGEGWGTAIGLNCEYTSSNALEGTLWPNKEFHYTYATV